MAPFQYSQQTEPVAEAASPETEAKNLEALERRLSEMWQRTSEAPVAEDED